MAIFGGNRSDQVLKAVFKVKYLLTWETGLVYLSTIKLLGGSPGLLVIREDPGSEGRGFKFLQSIY